MTFTAIVAGLTFGCSSVPAQPPDIVLVVLDTVRADHLLAYGHTRDPTPNLTRFTASATRYPRAWSSAPWTLPSHTSMLTGQPPHRHGARLGPDGRGRPYDGRFPTLPEVLSEAGYRTGAIVANTGFLSERWGLSRGFASYDVVHEDAAGIATRALAWLGSDSEPAFLLLNVMDAHRPWHTEPARPDVVGRAVEPSMAPLDQLKEIVLPGTRDAPAELVRTVVDQYDTALANLDTGLEPLLDQLAARDDAVVVITSDHGEYLGEHRLGEHPRDLYEPALRIPLFVRGGAPHESPDDVVLSHDLPRLVLEAAGHGELAARFPADPPPLAELHHDHAHLLAQPVLRARFDRVRRAWIDWPYKLIATDGGPAELYDLSRDPSETRDLAETESAVVTRLRDELLAVLGDAAPTATVAPQLSERERAQLRALGYLE